MLHRCIVVITCLLACVSVLSSACVRADSSSPLTIRIASSLEDYSIFRQAVEQGRCLETWDIAADTRRNELEILLLCRAFLRDNPEHRIELLPSANYARSIRMVKSGSADVSGETVWADDAEALALSNAVLAQGEIEKGIYTRVDHPVRSYPTDQVDLGAMHGVMVSNWTYDWQLINGLTGHVSSAMNTNSAFKIINLGRADFTLSELPATDDMSVLCGEERLFPIYGVKVLMPGARHFAVSNVSENADEVYAALNRGLQLMRESGELKTLYQHIGFMSERTQEWKVLEAKS
ncbi:hypothetical protein [Agaribacterium sp. ZY112]|uniref:hypothetical protein n=1 Tax=Agaribacterium sp. ZY112 TaxID=3233574 RepID=UPI0035255FA1